jgi:hypothetical protein
VNALRGQEFEVTALWYNPNIHPYLEHQRRLESMQDLAQRMNLPLIITEGYEVIDYFRAVVGHEGGRCPICYQMRLERTASLALEKGFAAFTTTLLISPYQKHELLREMGKEIGAKYGVEFHYQDFRKGFRESQRMARELELYRQKYCGCLYSEWERFGKVKIGG